MQELCAGGKIPVFTDCISFLTKARHRERAAFCVPGLFELPVSDKKVQLLRKAYQLGRNPLQMLTLQDPRAVGHVVRDLLLLCAQLLSQKAFAVGCCLIEGLASRASGTFDQSRLT